MRIQMKMLFALAALIGASVALSAPLSGTVRVDGSSTVFPITAAIAEEFQQVKEYRKVRVTVAYSGTGGGFKKWCKGETDINDASRHIKQREIDCAKKNKMTYLEIPVAYDGLSVVVSKKNSFLDSLSLEQLKKLWEPGSKVSKWNQLNAKWPATPVKLYGPGADSGTFDYFTEAVMHKARASRSDYVASEDDNVLVKGVTANGSALGYFGYAYYLENQRKLKVVKVDGGKGAIAPSEKTIKDGSYPLARPLHIYVSSEAVKKPEVRAFIEYYLTNAKNITKSVGYSPLNDSEYEDALKKFRDFVSKQKLS